mmetsp:Transcript_7992/g.22809  ORF Transcript_7992/g.22809 Transcript_7992/m.22809 type:complete len:201 (-) Transcript_7992:1034-1636(-)
MSTSSPRPSRSSVTSGLSGMGGSLRRSVFIFRRLRDLSIRFRIFLCWARSRRLRCRSTASCSFSLAVASISSLARCLLRSSAFVFCHSRICLSLASLALCSRISRARFSSSIFCRCRLASSARLMRAFFLLSSSAIFQACRRRALRWMSSAARWGFTWRLAFMPRTCFPITTAASSSRTTSSLARSSLTVFMAILRRAAA